MPIKLLYVDDNPNRLALLKARLVSRGYEVLTADNGYEALQLFRLHDIELAIVDYYMPGMYGDAVAREMRWAKPQVPIVMYSGALTLPEMVIALVDGFISTSDEPEALLKKIAELLEIPKPKPIGSSTGSGAFSH